jgi:hypothetical protein
MRRAKDAKRNVERDSRRGLGSQLSVLLGVAVATDRAVRLVGLAADEDPELGLLGVSGPRQVAQVCEEHRVRRARTTGWTWAWLLSQNPSAGVPPRCIRVCGQFRSVRA